MASFYKRGDYQWEAKIRKAGFPQLAKTFESKSDAVAWAAEVAMRISPTILMGDGEPRITHKMCIGWRFQQKIVENTDKVTSS